MYNQVIISACMYVVCMYVCMYGCMYVCSLLRLYIKSLGTLSAKALNFGVSALLLKAEPGFEVQILGFED